MQPGDIIRSLDAMNYQHLRLVCLWYRDEMRQRMIHGLASVFGLDPQTIDPAEGIPVPLDAGRVSAVFHCVPDFLVHGPTAGQETAVAHIPSLKKEPATLVGVWAETEFDAAAEEEDAMPPADRAGPASGPGPDEDAKHQARRTLARLGFVSQFTADRKEAKRKKPNGKQTDHQVILSLLDLCRSLGVIDRRIDQVMVDAIGPHAADQVAHCGIHVWLYRAVVTSLVDGFGRRPEPRSGDVDEFGRHRVSCQGSIGMPLVKGAGHAADVEGRAVRGDPA
ncbi:hypothetical protein AAHZ94_14940 [Streptomyces sp. HSW2009]|uniref:hypothetical protein n=1 Tax=Streptomyces sp. HSW2009 TaxID=3142890 RepID=UPI0032F08E9E